MSGSGLVKLWRFLPTVLLIVAACTPSTSDSTTTPTTGEAAEGLAEAAKEAAVAYADETFGAATGHPFWIESGSEATDVFVSGNGACAAVLVQFVSFDPDGFSSVMVLASLDHFTIPEVLEAHFHVRSVNIDDMTDLVGDRRWAPTFDAPYGGGGPEITLERFRIGAVVFDPSCETVFLSWSESYAEFRAQETACRGDQPPPIQEMSFGAAEVQADITATSKAVATIVTSCGEIVVELNPASAPETVNSFAFLAREGFFDGQVFHRIAKGFVIQGGDPEANGTGGPGYIIADEFPTAPDFVYEVGSVAMANRGARSTGSQFFFVIGDNAQHLTASFNVLGKVVSGQDTLERIATVPTGASPGSVEESLPLETVYIDSVTVDVENS